MREEFLQCHGSNEEGLGLSPSNFWLEQHPWEVAAIHPLWKSEPLPCTWGAPQFQYGSDKKV